MNNLVRKAGTADVSVVIRIVDSVDGTPETSVTSATTGLVLEYRREGATSTSLATIVDLSALTDAHTDKGIKHIGNGYYRLDLVDAACDTGSTGVLIHGTATGMVVMGCYVQLVAYDPFDTVRLGLTALPNAAADAAGGLPISDAGGLDLDALGAAILALPRVRSNTLAVGSTSSTAVLDASASSTDEFYNGMLLKLTGGTGSGQYRTIASATGSYDGTSKVATIDGTWTTTPDGTTTFEIWAMPPAPTTVSAALAAGEAGAIADAVCDEALAGHVAAGSVGLALASLPPRIRKNTALTNFPFLMVDSADGRTGKTGLTVTATRSIDGAAFGACANAVAAVGNGVYKIDLDATDLNGDTIVLKFTATGADARVIAIVTQSTT